jgi:cutinase
MMSRITRLLLAAVTIVGGWAVALPPANAAGCPHVEVIFARGTGEPPGIGEVGQQFVDALTHKVGNVGVYPVDYPASMDFTGSTIAGVTDIGHHIQYMAANCSSTRMVLGGYSQGAAVAGFVTSAVAPPGVDIGDLRVMDPWIASHVAAVVLFGTPSIGFLGMIGEPPIVIGPLYLGKTTQLCTDNDPVCSLAGAGGDWGAHSDYMASGRIEDGATFAAWRL